MGRILNPELSGLSDEEAAKRCCEEVDQLLKDIGMWLNFESFSVDEATIAGLPTAAMTSRTIRPIR